VTKCKAAFAAAAGFLVGLVRGLSRAWCTGSEGKSLGSIGRGGLVGL